jgi:uncharacterized membrane protein
MSLLLAFFIGFVAGLRSLTPPAAVAWAAHLGWLPLQGWLALLATLPAAVLFTIAALAELIADKSPGIPDRTSPPGLLARILTGGGTGVCLAAAGGLNLFIGLAAGAVGGIAGAFAGYHARKQLARALKVPDHTIALLEDLVAIGGALCIVVVAA